MSTTIAAIGTAIYNSGISIIRISGEKSLDIINKIFTCANKLNPNNIIYGKIKQGNIVIDTVLVSYFKSPYSFTGEDICEINCHGGVQITKQILEIVLQNGAILAEPGEFSKRAFLNGKMDLAQAEAVINLINAKTKTCTKVTSMQLEGKLSKEVQKLRDKFIEILAHIEVSIDYPEYDYKEVENDNVINLINENLCILNKIVSTYEQGKYLKEGINVSILGKPNVGKSSLLNALAKYEKAIVTNIPGTTRDIIEETINIGDFVINISDTAGIRETEDIIEKLGVEKTLKKIEESDLIIYIFNAAEAVSKDEIELLSKIQNKGLKIIPVINKMDTVQKPFFDTILKELKNIDIEIYIKMSIQKGEGIESLKEEILKICGANDFDFENELIILNSRHKDLLKKTITYLEESKEELLKNTPIDIISIFIKNATKTLGEIIGADVSADIVNKIFEKFCLGK